MSGVTDLNSLKKGKKDKDKEGGNGDDDVNQYYVGGQDGRGGGRYSASRSSRLLLQRAEQTVYRVSIFGSVSLWFRLCHSTGLSQTLSTHCVLTICSVVA